MSIFKKAWNDFRGKNEPPLSAEPRLRPQEPPQQAAPEPPEPKELPEQEAAFSRTPGDDRATHERMRDAYVDIFSTLYDRHILTQLNWPEIVRTTSPPTRTFADEFETVKILPPPEPEMANMERFWNSLRSIKEPLAFELFIQPETMYFRLSFPKGNLPLIERQLSLHFPGEYSHS